MNHPLLTRRAFTGGGLAAMTGSVALTVLGCKSEADPIGAKLPAKPVRAGPVSRYFKAGVYDDLKSHNIWLYSDGTHLVALAAVCPHQFCITRFDSMTGQYVCPCHSSRFTIEGLVKKGSKAERSLERCRIDLVAADGQSVVEVTPAQRFREDKNQWSTAQSILVMPKG